MNSRRLFVLVKGELSRLNKYNVTSISILIAIIWGIILFFIEGDAFQLMLPYILVLDATIMSIMYIGSVMFFEKSESTISTMLVTPSTNSELVLSKVLANVLHNMFSSLLILIVFYFIKDIKLHWMLILIAILVATAFHTIIGLFLAYFQKDFTGMLVNIMIFSFILIIPSALYQFQLLKADIWEYILLINPVQAAQVVINGGLVNYVYEWDYYFSLGYLIIGSILSYKFLILPKFHDYAIKQSGV